MKYKGLIFDFNGTVFWDTRFHNAAWDLMLPRHGRECISDEEKFLNIHGHNNTDIFNYLFPGLLTPEQIRAMAAEKEQIYRDICIQHHMELAPGLTVLLDYLKEHGIRRNIATASNKENIDFYFEHLGLGRWFDYGKVSYDDGTVKSKPDPEIFLRAIDRLDLQPEETVIFEDSQTGLKAATAARPGKVVIVNSDGDDYTSWPNYDIITNYDAVNRQWLAGTMK